MGFKVPNQYRLRTGPMGSDDSIGLCGAFQILKQNKGKKYILTIIADDGKDTGWEHVSCYKMIYSKRFIPSWSYMCLVKSLFWDDEDCVIQYHPAKKDYVNCNPYVLHLWRPIGLELPMPPKELV